MINYSVVFFKVDQIEIILICVHYFVEIIEKADV